MEEENNQKGTLPRQAPSPLVAISILNWNGWQDTIECLESVRKLDYPNYLTVVVDNGSWNDSAERIKAWAEQNLGTGHVLADYSRETALAGGDPEVETALDCSACPSRMVIVPTAENLGFPGGHNVSIGYALNRSRPADYVLLLNNDTIAPPDCLTTLVSVAQRSAAGVVGALVMDPSGLRPDHPGIASLRGLLFKPFQKVYTPYPEKGGDFWETSFVHGAGMLVASGVLRDVLRKRSSYLNGDYFLYLEEFEFLVHVIALGHKAGIAPRARLPHGRGKSSNIVICTYYTYRNLVFLSKLVLSPLERALFNATTLAALPVRLLRLALKRRPDLARAVYEGQRDGYLGRMGKWKRHDEVVLTWRERNNTRSQPTPRLAKEGHTR